MQVHALSKVTRENGDRKSYKGTFHSKLAHPEISRISVRIVHLLIRDAADVVYRIIAFVDLPVFTIAPTGFHHCNTRYLCRNITLKLIKLLYNCSKTLQKTLILKYYLLSTLEIESNTTKDKRLTSPHVVLVRHVRTNVHDILHSNELTNNKFTPQINIQTFLTSPKIQFPLNTNYLIRNPSIEDDFETNSHLLGDVFIDNCQKFPQI